MSETTKEPTSPEPSNAAPSGEFTNRKPEAHGEGPGAAALDVAAMIEELLDELEGTVGGYETAGTKERPQLDLERTEIRGKITALIEKLGHGDEKHQAWLHDKSHELAPQIIAALRRQPSSDQVLVEELAWVATKGDDVLYFSKHDGWSVKAVLTERGGPEC